MYLTTYQEILIFIMSSISSFDIIRIVIPDPKIFLCIPASAADVAAVNTNGINTLLTNGLGIFLLVVNQFLVMHREVYQKILLIILF